MDAAELRRTLVETGRVLVDEGLVARTWGNFSLREGDDRFLITPSGRSYESLKDEEMASLDLESLEWTGPLKPSSEKELHSRVYRVRPDVGAIIHTHQPAASSVAAARLTLPVSEKHDRDLLGPRVPCAAYALPTTKPLAKAVEKLAVDADVKAILLANHGAVCFGGNMEEALNVARALERVADSFVLQRFRDDFGQSNADRQAMLDTYAAKKGRV